MKISDVMTRSIETVGPDHSAQDAATFMLNADTGAIPVTDGDRLIGMITDRDIAVRGVAKGYGPETKVRDLMTDDIVSVRHDDNVEDVATRMSEAQVRRVPVLDDESKLCGMVSLGDLSRQAGGDAAREALDGISQPGGQHQQ